MLRDFAWNAFKITGNPDMYVFYKEVLDLKNTDEAEPEKVEENTLQG